LHGEIGTAPYAHPYRILREPVARKGGMAELGGVNLLLYTKKTIIYSMVYVPPNQSKAILKDPG